jgi:hypothetical protein
MLAGVSKGMPAFFETASFGRGSARGYWRYPLRQLLFRSLLAEP